MAVGKGGSLAVVTLVQPHGQQGGSQAAKGSASTTPSVWCCVCGALATQTLKEVGGGRRDGPCHI